MASFVAITAMPLCGETMVRLIPPLIACVFMYGRANF
jgi:hypothetical protein